MRSQPFNAVHHALQPGVHLVEASAGTGKTFAIAMLVLRFVAQQKFDIDRILTVTYTRAATAELRSRVRERLVEGQEILRGVKGRYDTVLQEWALTIPPQKRPEICLRLRQAIANIDQAAIFTIHGFCQRMLMERALESGQPFDAELLTDTSAIVQEVVDDFWRGQLYGGSPQLSAAVGKVAQTPEGLLATLNSCLRSGSLAPERTKSPQEAEQILNQERQHFCNWWQENGVDLAKQYEQDAEAGFFIGTLKKEWAVALVLCEEMVQGGAIPEELRCFSREEMGNPANGWLAKAKVKEEAKGKAISYATFLAQRTFAPVEALLDADRGLLLSVRATLAQQLRSELTRRMEERGCLSFDSLIHNLAQALVGAEGRLLREGLAGRFDVALIDEFQDTDGDQYAIFSTLFGSGRHHLYLIGDPKQAIYSFRGADIHSYFAARRAASSLLTLDTNYRSHPEVVSGVNSLFSTRPEPFLYEEAMLPFEPVSARPEEVCDRLEMDGERAVGVEYWRLPNPEKGRWTSGRARTALLEWVVEEILQLLSRRACIVNGKRSRPVVPQDIAILVRTNSTAGECVEALAGAGIPAVALSRQSVFESEQCAQLLQVLQAILDPGDLRHFHGALTCHWFGMQGSALKELFDDETRMGRWRERMLEYRRRWQEGSFFAMMTDLLHHEEVLQRLAVEPRGERMVANLQQLLGLARDAAEERNLQPGELLQWLRRCREGRERREDELLLESDEDAVQVVTMHRAKGLEYGVVFCLDLWQVSDRLSREKMQVVAREKGRTLIDLGSPQFETHRRAASFELEAEGLRLLYVAITRARLRCIVPWVDCRSGNGVADSLTSPLAWLLFGTRRHEEGNVPELSEAEQQAALEQHCAGEGAGGLESGIEASAASPRKSARPLPLHLITTERDLATHWQLTSFSSLARLSELEHEAVAGAAEGAEEPASHTILQPDLPAGPHFGNVIHGLLEELPFTNLAGEQFAGRSDALCRRFGLNLGAEPLQQLLQTVVQGALPTETGSFTLGQLEEAACLKEMEFCMELGECAAEEIGGLLCVDPAVAPLSQRQLEGFLTGFIDLICYHGGRYWLLDYKSNNLGNDSAAYSGEALIRAMRSHNYGLQYWIYTLVLHRWLGHRIENYSYEEHFGGIFYLFVRGMEPGRSGGVFRARPDLELLEQFDALIAGKGEKP